MACSVLCCHEGYSDGNDISLGIERMCIVEGVNGVGLRNASSCRFLTDRGCRMEPG